MPQNPNIARTVQSLAPGLRVELYTLDLTPLGVNETLYFSPSSIGNQEISFGGQVYSSIPIQTEGFEVTGQGSLPQPKMRIANVNNLAISIASQFNDLVGALVTRRVTFSQYLDGGSVPDTGALFPLEVFEVIQKTKQNKVYIEWKLASMMDRDGDLLPKRQVWKGYCSWQYRRWDKTLNNGAGGWDYTDVECPYTGENGSFDANDQPVADQSLDVPSKRVSCCKTRFGEFAVLPFGGFIGVGVQAQ